MNPETKRWLVKSAGLGAGFTLAMLVLVCAGLWYAVRPAPPIVPKPWSRAAIRAEFLEISTSDVKGAISLWYTVTNFTDQDYRIESMSGITTAGITSDDALFGFNQGVSFDLPLVVIAHRKAKLLLQIETQGQMKIENGASETAVLNYKKDVQSFLHSEYSGIKDIAVMDEQRRYEIDFPVP